MRRIPRARDAEQKSLNWLDDELQKPLVGASGFFVLRISTRVFGAQRSIELTSRRSVKNLTIFFLTLL